MIARIKISFSLQRIVLLQLAYTLFKHHYLCITYKMLGKEISGVTDGAILNPGDSSQIREELKAPGKAVTCESDYLVTAPKNSNRYRFWRLQHIELSAAHWQ
jgi:hypothetical protein